MFAIRVSSRTGPGAGTEEHADIHRFLLEMLGLVHQTARQPPSSKLGIGKNVPHSPHSQHGLTGSKLERRDLHMTCEDLADRIYEVPGTTVLPTPAREDGRQHRTGRARRAA